MRNFLLFLLITLFGTAIVFTAAKDIRKRLAPATPEERAWLQQMLRDLRGDYGTRAQKAAMDKESMPARSVGGYVVKHDIVRLKKFLRNLIHPESLNESGQSETSKRSQDNKG